VADGPALTVEARDGEGQPVTVQSLAGGTSSGDRAYLVFDQPQAERNVTVPDLDLVLRIVAQGNQPPGQVTRESFVVQGYETGSSIPIVETSVDKGRAVVRLGRGTVVLTPERYSMLQAAYAPGLIWLFLGALLVLVGVTLPLLWPNLQACVQLVPDRRAVTADLTVAVHGASLDAGRELQRLAASLGGSGARQE
jgi:hypothetical protein